MKTKQLVSLASVPLMVLALTATTNAQSPKMRMTTPIPPEITTPDTVETRLGTLNFKNGMPDQATIDKVYDNIDFARAVDVYLNNIRAISMYSNRKGLRDIGVKDNTVFSAERLNDSTGFYLTPNTVTPQTWPYLDLTKGPIVLELPPNVLGLADDMWMRYVVDLGLLGPDKGKGGKYLFLPPGYQGKIPDGYFVVKSPTFGVWTPWRNFAVNGDVKPAIESLHKNTKIYPFSEAGKNPTATVFSDGSMRQVNTIPPSTYVFYEYLAALVQEEPAGVAGPELTGQMAAIGIEKGKPFKPDARMKNILTEAAAVANATARAILFKPRADSAYYYGKTSAWFNPFQGGYLFEENGARNLDGRVAFFYFATGITPAMAQAKVGSGSQYAAGAQDSEGRWLDGSKNYKLTLPKDIPHNSFWSVSLYDSQTRSLLQTDNPFPAIGAGKNYPKQEGMAPVVMNANGSTDIYFGPTAPRGKESNWVQTVPGRGWFTLFRLYNPLQPWFDKTWKPGEIELVDQVKQ